MSPPVDRKFIGADGATDRNRDAGEIDQHLIEICASLDG
jgi:hypothetical protein